jgi:hypothetical protein
VEGLGLWLVRWVLFVTCADGFHMKPGWRLGCFDVELRCAVEWSWRAVFGQGRGMADGPIMSRRKPKQIAARRVCWRSYVLRDRLRHALTSSRQKSANEMHGILSPGTGSGGRQGVRRRLNDRKNRILNNRMSRDSVPINRFHHFGMRALHARLDAERRLRKLSRIDLAAEINIKLRPAG